LWAHGTPPLGPVWGPERHYRQVHWRHVQSANRHGLQGLHASQGDPGAQPESARNEGVSGSSPLGGSPRRPCKRGAFVVFGGVSYGLGRDPTRGPRCPSFTSRCASAIEWGEADTNPVSVVRKPRQGRRKAVRPLPPEDVERLRADLLSRNDHRSATLISVLAYTGMGPGEALRCSGATSATPDDYVFPRTDGDPWRSDDWSQVSLTEPRRQGIRRSA
jgi:hypothetical protein